MGMAYCSVGRAKMAGDARHPVVFCGFLWLPAGPVGARRAGDGKSAPLGLRLGGRV